MNPPWAAASKKSSYQHRGGTVAPESAFRCDAGTRSYPLTLFIAGEAGLGDSDFPVPGFGGGKLVIDEIPRREARQWPNGFTLSR